MTHPELILCPFERRHRARGTCGSPSFISRTRNPNLEQPKRFEPTVKAAGDVVI